jgi:hypothetical protein
LAFSSIYAEADWASREYFEPKVQDVVFNSNATTAVLRANAVTTSGGTSIDGFTLFKAGTQGGWINKEDPLNHAFEKKHDAARWQQKILTEPVALFVADILDNEGSEQRRFDLIMHENMAAAKTMANTFGASLYALDFGLATAGAIDSLCHGVNDETGTTHETSFSATYAGVLRAATGDTAGWNANVNDTDAEATMGVLNDSYMDASEGVDQPTLITSNNKAFSFYYDELTPQQRQMTDDMLGKGGFRALMFNGVPWVVDSHVPSSDRSVPSGVYGTAPSTEYIYMLNTNVIEIKAHRRAFFSFWGVKEPIDQWSVVGRYFFYGNVPVYNPRFCSVLSAITS